MPTLTDNSGTAVAADRQTLPSQSAD